MFCTNCGKEIPEGQNGIPVRFCPYCGGKVLVLPPENTAAVPAEETVAAAEEAVQAAEETVAAAEEAVQAAEETVAAAEETVQAAEETATAEEAVQAAEETVAAAEETVQAAEETAAAEEAVQAEEETAAAEEAVQAAEEETVVAAEEAVQAAAEETVVAAEAPKKKSKAPIIALIAVIVLAAAGYFIYQSLPSTKVSKLMKEASALNASAQFDEAVQKYDEALAIAPDNTEIKAAKADTFIAKAKSFFADDDYNKALLTYYDAMISVSGLGDSTEESVSKRVSEDLSSMSAAMVEKGSFSSALDILNEKNKMFESEMESTAVEILNVYKTWADKVKDSGDAKKAAELADIISKARDAKELASVKIDMIEPFNMLTAIKYRAQLAEVGLMLKPFLDSGDTNAACDTLYEIMLKKFSDYYSIINWVTLDQSNRLPFIADIDGNTGIGIYKASDRFIIYIGSYDASGKRSGEGAWLTCLGTPTSDYRKYCATGTWKDDLPNGQFTIMNYTKKTTDDGSTKTTKVNVVNGLYQGEAEYSVDNGVTYRPSFENGHPVIIEDYEMNGTTYHIAAYGDDEISFYHFTKGSEAVEAIFGFDGQ